MEDLLKQLLENWALENGFVKGQKEMEESRDEWRKRWCLEQAKNIKLEKEVRILTEYWHQTEKAWEEEIALRKQLEKMAKELQAELSKIREEVKP